MIQQSRKTMQAMRLHATGSLTDLPAPLLLEEVPAPEPAEGECLIKIAACGVCHTELDEIEARTPPTFLPIIPGHQVVGSVTGVGAGVDDSLVGKTVGVAWIWSVCGECEFCSEGRENLCSEFVATGRDRHGGYAELTTAPAEFVHPIPESINARYAAPLLCAGAVGNRALRLCGIEDGDALGFTGFGASGHLVIQMARALYPQSPVAVFARNPAERNLARELGAAWTGDTAEDAPFQLAAIVDTTPAWLPVTAAMRQLKAGGRLVINAIRKEEKDRHVMADIDYETQLWMEKSIRSVANVTRKDVRECLDLAERAVIRPEVTSWQLHQANEALAAIRSGTTRGAHVLLVD
jgi:propanol-preferring alcohol dehydrogenase